MTADVDIEELTELARTGGQNDVAIAMQQLYTNIDAAYPDDDAVDEAVEDTDLPFHDEDRELAFALGVMFGAFLEIEYPTDSGESVTSPTDSDESVGRTNRDHRLASAEPTQHDGGSIEETLA